MKTPKQILIKNAVALQTVDEKLTEYSTGSILIQGNIVKKIGRKITAYASGIFALSIPDAIYIFFEIPQKVQILNQNSAFTKW
jgi:uncharacterized protein YdeI (BOF family)